MKVILIFLSFFVMSMCITSLCVDAGWEPWEILLANVGAGATLGLITGMFE